MRPLTLQDVEREIQSIAERADWSDRVQAEPLRALARRIGVQLAMQQIDHPEAA